MRVEPIKFEIEEPTDLELTADVYVHSTLSRDRSEIEKEYLLVKMKFRGS